MVHDAVDDCRRELVVSDTVPHLLNSTLAVNMTLLLSQLSEITWQSSLAPSTSKGT